jgi:hypothetical protein
VKILPGVNPWKGGARVRSASASVREHPTGRNSAHGSIEPESWQPGQRCSSSIGCRSQADCTTAATKGAHCRPAAHWQADGRFWCEQTCKRRLRNVQNWSCADRQVQAFQPSGRDHMDFSTAEKKARLMMAEPLKVTDRMPEGRRHILTWVGMLRVRNLHSALTFAQRPRAGCPNRKSFQPDRSKPIGSDNAPQTGPKLAPRRKHVRLDVSDFPSGRDCAA